MSVPTACTCFKPAGSHDPATSSLPASSKAPATRRRRHDGDWALHNRHPGLDPGPAFLRAARTRRVPAQGRDDGRGAPMTAPFPTHKQEEWRYADLEALQPVWEQFAEPVTLTVG